MYFLGKESISEDRERYGADNIKTGIKKQDRADLAHRMNNLCVFVNVVMNILPSAAVRTSSISGSENPTGIFFISIYYGSFST